MGSALLALVCAAAIGTSLRADPYPRQPLDVEHYRFSLSLSDTTDRVRGDAQIRVKLLASNLSQLWFDLADQRRERNGRGMRVSEVRLAGRSLVFSHAEDRLLITLPAAQPAGATLTIDITYDGIPFTGLHIGPTPHGDRAFFSDNWPDKGHHWLPLIDHVADKATMEMLVRAPAHYQVISNGLRTESTDSAGTRVTAWRQSVPISPWLFALGVADFAVQRVGEYDGKEISSWVFAHQRDAGFFDYAVPTKDALAFYSEWIGPFAYEKLANVQSNSVSGGMEAASAIFYSSGSVVGNRPVRWRNVIIHEVAHQWFGNAVTESDWNDVWLSEGFATYFTLLFIEHAYGRDEFVAGLLASRKAVIDFDAKTPDYRVVHANLADMAQVTTRMIYEKGAWTLHMLRTQLGDEVFWAGIREYYARHYNGTATTADFRAVMERVSGQDLKPFFEQWLYRGGIPRVQWSWEWDAKASQVVVNVRQTQAGAPFVMPIEVAIVAADGTRRIERGMLSSAVVQLRFAAAARPTAVELDPEVRALINVQIVPR